MSPIPSLHGGIVGTITRPIKPQSSPSSVKTRHVTLTLAILVIIAWILLVWLAPLVVVVEVVRAFCILTGIVVVLMLMSQMR
jgi:hypothetical protein